MTSKSWMAIGCLITATFGISSNSHAAPLLETAEPIEAASTRTPTAPNPLPSAIDSPFPQPAPPVTPLPPESTPPLTPPASPASPPPPSSAPPIPVTRIEVIGSTVFTTSDFAELTAPYVDRSVTLEELRQLADQITQRYLDAGYLTSRAVLVDQQIRGGVVQIRAIEGSLERIEIEGLQRVNAQYVRSRIALGSQVPLRQAHLEEQLRLLRLDPLFSTVEASLRPSRSVGQSTLLVRVTENHGWIAGLGVDNFSPPSVGSERTTAVVGHRNVTGLGDQLTVSYARSTTGGSNSFDFSYRLPLNPRNGTLQLRAAPSFYHITDPRFASLDISGNTARYEVSYRQPLIRRPTEELALSIGFSYEDGQTLIASLLSDASTTSVLQLGQDYVRRDRSGAWSVRSQFNLGTGLFDASQTSDSTPDGQFLSWVGQVQRVQVLSPNQLLIARLEAQLTPDPLLSSQQFFLGGAQSVRGYRQNARSGDNGILFSIENRITVAHREDSRPVLQLAPFADIGTVWNDAANPESLPDHRILAAIGVGVLWEPMPHLNIRTDFALPFVSLVDRGENAQDRGVHFSVNWQY